MTTLPQVNDRGFTTLYEPSNPTADIVFVHGFTGHPKKTWTAKPKRRSAKPKREDEREKTSATTKPPSKVRSFLSVRGKTRIRSTSPKLRIPDRTIRPSSPASSTSSVCHDIRGNNGVKENYLERDVYWPADLAPVTAPDSRILTYGYDTHVRHWAGGQVSQKTLYDHANDLISSLEARRRDDTEKQRPVLFIVHSLGGLVTKVALRKAYMSTKPHIHQLYKTTVGIVFFGTPHRGADPRNFVHHVLSASVNFLGYRVNNRIVNTLMPEEERLADWGQEFLTMCHERKWVVYSFQEEYGVAGLFGKKVVEDSSSCLDDPTVETKQHIASNHMDMCRFTDVDGPEYEKVAAAITFILEKATDNDPGGPPAEDAAPVPETTEVTEITRSTPAASVVVNQSSDDSQYGAPSDTSHDIIGKVKEKLVNQLYFDKIDERLTGLTAARGTTCRWFLSSPAYQSWIDPEQSDTHSGFLWIKGSPGTGKSTLMKFLFENAKDKSVGIPSQIVLSFFFIARGTAEERSTGGLYRSLLHKLFEQDKGLVNALDWLTADGARVIERNGWHDEALKQTLRHVIRRLGHRSLTIFIDALDECKKGQAADMVSFFEELCDLAVEAQVSLQICFSSRHYPTVVIDKGIELTLEVQDGQAADIQAYIRSKLRVGKSKAAQALMSDIFDKSSRIFLWVVLVLDILNAEFPSHFGSVKNMRKRLTDIPEGLADLFEMILMRDQDNLKQLQACLKWILFANRALHPEELYFAVQFALDKDCNGYWDDDDLDVEEMESFVRTASKGLAEVTGETNQRVQLIHESVRDFLLGKHKGQLFEASDDFSGRCHELLRDCCLAQIMSPFIQIDEINALVERLPDMKARVEQMDHSIFGNGWLRDNIASFCQWVSPRDSYTLAHKMSRAGDILPGLGGLLSEIHTVLKAATLTMHQPARDETTWRFPFLMYSLDNVLAHAETSQEDGIDQSRFLAGFALQRWIALYNTTQECRGVRFAGLSSLLYLLSVRNMPALIRVLPEPGSCLVPDKGTHVPPLFAALTANSTEAANTLIALETGTEPPHRERDKGRHGRDEQARPDRPVNYRHGMTILEHATMWHDEGLLEDLLAEGFDLDDSTRLGIAASLGRSTVVQQLLDKGDVGLEERDIHGLTPLCVAVRNGHVEVARLLLNTGRVDVNAQSKKGDAPLDWAVANGDNDLITLLQDYRNVNVDKQDIHGQASVSNSAEAEDYSSAVKL